MFKEELQQQSSSSIKNNRNNTNSIEARTMFMKHKATKWDKQLIQQIQHPKDNISIRVNQLDVPKLKRRYKQLVQQLKVQEFKTIPSFLNHGGYQSVKVQATIGEINRKVILDCGATCCIMSKGYWKKNLKHVGRVDLNRKIEMKLANGQVVYSAGVLFDVPIMLGNVTRRIDFLLVDGKTSSLILGLDFIKMIGAVLDFKNNMVYIENDSRLSFIV
jgi:hypothetical protein